MFKMLGRPTRQEGTQMCVCVFLLKQGSEGRNLLRDQGGKGIMGRSLNGLKCMEVERVNSQRAH